MSGQTFEATLLSGHKEDAVEVPFDPAERLGLANESLGPGRRGYRVKATLNGQTFDSAVVSRSKQFWLLVPASVVTAAGVAINDSVQISLRA
ncbi:MAG: DUF1905 domain-containing protein [Sphingobacteriales bacterium]|nr:MAG: DUF1905 domain-containing protein [Sphingobacteriales bacterium]